MYKQVLLFYYMWGIQFSLINTDLIIIVIIINSIKHYEELSQTIILNRMKKEKIEKHLVQNSYFDISSLDLSVFPT